MPQGEKSGRTIVVSPRYDPPGYRSPDSPQIHRQSALSSAAPAHESPDQQIGTTIISVEEQWRGWFAVIARHRNVRRQVKAYEELVTLHEFLSGWTILPFADAAADRFEQLRGDGVRIGSMDLKIGSIAFIRDALVLSANLQDSRQIPASRVENRLD